MTHRITNLLHQGLSRVGLVGGFAAAALAGAPLAMDALRPAPTHAQGTPSLLEFRWESSKDYKKLYFFQSSTQSSHCSGSRVKACSCCRHAVDDCVSVPRSFFVLAAQVPEAAGPIIFQRIIPQSVFILKGFSRPESVRHCRRVARLRSRRVPPYMHVIYSTW